MATRRSRNWGKHLARRVMETLIQWLMHVTARTCRWEFIDCHAAEKALFDNDQGVILITPHENVISVLTLALAGWPFKGKVIISNHQTVDWVYKIVEKLGIGLIIVDKNDPSQNVNEQVKETLAKGDTVIITPDGPLGPPHKFDPGVWLLARRHRAEVVFLNGFWTRRGKGQNMGSAKFHYLSPIYTLSALTHLCLGKSLRVCGTKQLLTARRIPSIRQ